LESALGLTELVAFQSRKKKEGEGKPVTRKGESQHELSDRPGHWGKDLWLLSSGRGGEHYPGGGGKRRRNPPEKKQKETARPSCGKKKVIFKNRVKTGEGFTGGGKKNIELSSYSREKKKDNRRGWWGRKPTLEKHGEKHPPDSA